MEKIHTLLIHNRGEIALRIHQTASRLNINTIALYTPLDASSPHVSACTTAHPITSYLSYPPSSIVADAVIPGYGFLSESPSFATHCAAQNIHLVGPSAAHIAQFGLKHTARQLAVSAGVPIVPGTDGLVMDAAHAVAEAGRLGYPVMVKATAGGGGMGLAVCADADAVAAAFAAVTRRTGASFGDEEAGVFIERYYDTARHIEVQVFGNGMGDVATLGERECSVQRRHQKVVEECPSAYVSPELRERLCAAAKALAMSVNYASVGTVEFLVDEKTGDFFFLEMNTRLQVEHGVTELVYGVDLVELMLRQADAELAGRGGLSKAEIDALDAKTATGWAVETRVYAENPIRDFAPAPGLLQEVNWGQQQQQNQSGGTTRIDTWVRAGITIGSEYDPMLAKVIQHAPTRPQAIDQLAHVLATTTISGPPTNLDFLAAILSSQPFQAAQTTTHFLSTAFQYRPPPCIDVLAGGAYTLVQDYPGRPTIGRGFGHGGPMDPLAFQLANALVGNQSLGKEALELTLAGPDLRFLGGDAIVALTGASTHATLDGVEFPMWTRVKVAAGQRLTIGKIGGEGCRAYLAVYGGFPSVAEWFGSKATVPMTGIGGYQGRPLRAGDLLKLVDNSKLPPSNSISIPPSLRPVYVDDWELQVLQGPYCEDYLTAADITTFFTTAFTVSHNAARGGIRLLTTHRPHWARADGGEGGSHPSNVIEYGYPIGGVNFTGDEPVLFPVDCPDFGGFVVPFTVVKADHWKMGQLRAGDTVRFRPITMDDALMQRRYIEAFIQAVNDGDWDRVKGLQHMPRASVPTTPQPAVLHVLEATPTRPKVTYRQGGDDYLLIDYGEGSFDLNHKCRTTALQRRLASHSSITHPLHFSATGTSLYNTVRIGNSMMLYFNALSLHPSTLLTHLIALEQDQDQSPTAQTLIPNRTFTLPLTFTHPALTASIDRYTANQRPYASYLPDPFAFLAANNGLSSPNSLRTLFLEAQFVCVGVGFFMALPECLPADPRHRLRSPKMNPSRTFTPAGTVAWGGSCMAIYPVDSPGGYMMAGMTIPGVDALGWKEGFARERPWLFEDMDVLVFEEVSEEEYDRLMALFNSGRYVWKVKDSVFDMAAHNDMLKRVEGEVQAMRERQKEYEDKMVKLEKELLVKWDEERKAKGVSVDMVQALLDDPDIEAIEAPVNANVWKVLVDEGKTLQKGDVAAILEAMKMEINVVVDDRLEGCTVEKLLIAPNDIVQSGSPLVLVRNKGSR